MRQLQATSENVRSIIEEVQAHTAMSRAEVAEWLGVSESGLKKHLLLESSPSYRPIHPSAWTLLLLLADRHPVYRLEGRVTPIRRRKRSSRAD